MVEEMKITLIAEIYLSSGSIKVGEGTVGTVLKETDFGYFVRFTIDDKDYDTFIWYFQARENDSEHNA